MSPITRRQAVKCLAIRARDRGIALNTTKVAKLIYLTDLHATRRHGSPCTDTRWIWYNHGPWDHAFHRDLQTLEAEGTLEVHEEISSVRTAHVRATAAASVDAADEFLASLDLVLDAYGHLAAAELRDLTYKTGPMLVAQRNDARGEPLDLHASPNGSLIDTAMALLDDEDMAVDVEPDELPRWHEPPAGEMLSAGPGLYRRL